MHLEAQSIESCAEDQDMGNKHREYYYIATIKAKPMRPS